MGCAVTAPDARLRVIVADDDPDIRDLVSIAVDRAGLELIDQQFDGETAWLAIQKHLPDIVLLDVSMPGMTGVDVCRLIRSDPRTSHIRALLLSASVTEEARAVGLAAGANQYLTKPFSPRELVEQLTEVAEGMKARL